MDNEPIPISALNQYGYCPRRCALIHIEQTFDENLYTMRSRAVHERVDQVASEIQEGVRIERALPRLFENDASSARPEGSMEVLKVIWWKHHSKAGQYSSAKVHRTLTVKPDGSIDLGNLDNLTPEIINGF